MSTSAFLGTPGRWRRESVPSLYLEELGLECEIVRDDAGEPVAFVPYRPGEYHIVGMANCELIAAIPDLLADLTAICDEIDQGADLAYIRAFLVSKARKDIRRAQP